MRNASSMSRARNNDATGRTARPDTLGSLRECVRVNTGSARSSCPRRRPACRRESSCAKTNALGHLLLQVVYDLARGERANVGIRLHWVADAEAIGSFRRIVRRIAGDTLVNDEPFGRDARLSVSSIYALSPATSAAFAMSADAITMNGSPPSSSRSSSHSFRVRATWRPRLAASECHRGDALVGDDRVDPIRPDEQRLKDAGGRTGAREQVLDGEGALRNVSRRA